MMGFNLRFHPSMVQLKNLLESRSPICFIAEYGSYQDDGFRKRLGNSAGIVFDVVHEFDYLHWLFGDVSSICCFSDGERYVDVLVLMRNGVDGTVHFDFLQRERRRYCKVICEDDTVFFDYVSGQWKYEYNQMYRERGNEFRSM